LDPKAAARVLHERWDAFGQEIVVMNREIIVKEDYLKPLVELQKRFEHVVFVPRRSFSNPLLGIFKGPKHIMKVNDYAVIKSG
jgi:hypothetical protein